MSTGIWLGDSHIQRAECVSLLGIHLDQHLNLKHHIARKATAVACAVFNLMILRRYLSKETCLQPAVKVRCEYKVLVLVFKCLNNLAPSYLSNLLSPQSVAYNTRSASRNMLAIPFIKHKTFADRSFSVAGPKLWNKLPENIKCSSSVDDF